MTYLPMPKPAYTVRPDGHIEFLPEGYDRQQAMFAVAGIDIATLRTEADYQEAFSAVGTYLFEALLDDALAGNRDSQAVWRAFIEERYGDMKALVRRQTFTVIDGKKSAP